MGVTITLVEVADEAEESAFLDRVEATADARRDLVLPVLRRDGLADTARRLLHEAGLAFREVRPDGWTPADDPNADSPWASLPDIVLATPRVDAGVLRLLRTLGRRTIGTLDAPPTAGRDALVLIAPEDTGPELTRGLERLAASTPCLGVVPIDGAVDGRATAIKLLATSRPALSQPWVLASAYDLDLLRHAPATVAHAPEAVETACAQSDLLVFCGHADAWDAHASPEHVFCARAAGTTSAADGLPCTQTGACYRQERAGRDPFSSDGLIDIAALAARVLAIEGCSVLRLAAPADALRGGLVHRAFHGRAAAVLASLELMRVLPAADAALIAALLDGRDLGEATALANRIRRKSQGAPVHRALGPLLLLGNPRLAFTATPPLRAVSVPVEGGIMLTLPAEATAAQGCFVRFDVDTGLGHHACVHDLPESLWLHGAIDDDGCGYLWARAAGPEPPGPLRIAFHDHPPWATERAAWRALIDALLGWVPVLGILSARCAHTGGPKARATDYDAFLQTLPSVVDLFARGVSTLLDDEGVLVSHAARDRYCARLREKGVAVIELLLHLALQALGEHGIGAVLELEGREEVLEQGQAGEACSCGQGTLWAQHFALASRLRVEHQCDSCGGIDVDDGRRRVRLRRVDPGPRPGARSLRIVLTAPPDEALTVACAVTLEPWLRSEAWTPSEVSTIVVAAGSTVDVDLLCPIPPSARPGLNRLCVIAVANGAMSLHRRSLRLSVDHTGPAPYSPNHGKSTRSGLSRFAM